MIFSDWVLKRCKVLERYTGEQSDIYDMKLYIELTRGHWIFKETIKFEVYRCNLYYDRAIGRQKTIYDSLSLNGVYYSYDLPNGDKLEQFGKYINAHFTNMYKAQYKTKEKQKRINYIKEIKK